MGLSSRNQGVAKIEIVHNSGEVLAASSTPPTEVDSSADNSTSIDELQAVAETLVSLPNWSSKIRYLNSEGFTNGDISRILTALRGKKLRLQHVSNVLNRPLKGGRQGRRPALLSSRAQELLDRAMPQSQSQLQLALREKEEE
jgi:hypothetical protein